MTQSSRNYSEEEKAALEQEMADHEAKAQAAGPMRPPPDTSWVELVDLNATASVSFTRPAERGAPAWVGWATLVVALAVLVIVLAR